MIGSQLANCRLAIANCRLNNRSGAAKWIGDWRLRIAVWVVENLKRFLNLDSREVEGGRYCLYRSDPKRGQAPFRTAINPRAR
jgi:hypothetical protein